MRLPDIDIFEGSRRVVPPEPMESGTEEEEMGTNTSITTVGGNGSKAVDHLSLVANRLPSKPTEAVQANLVDNHSQTSFVPFLSLHLTVLAYLVDCINVLTHSSLNRPSYTEVNISLVRKTAKFLSA